MNIEIKLDKLYVTVQKLFENQFNGRNHPPPHKTEAVLERFPNGVDRHATNMYNIVE